MYWHPAKEECSCLGTGWGENLDSSCIPCPLHFEGQLHPDIKTKLINDPRLPKEEKIARLKFSIAEHRMAIAELNAEIKAEEEAALILENELINETPTVRTVVILNSNNEIEAIRELAPEEVSF